MQTYWLNPGRGKGSRGSISDSDAGDQSFTNGDDAVDTSDAGWDDRKERLIDWNVEKLVEILKQIIARRDSTSESSNESRTRISGELAVPVATPLEEVKEIIQLPEFNIANVRSMGNPDDVQIPQEVITQIRDFVTCVANM